MDDRRNSMDDNSEDGELRGDEEAPRIIREISRSHLRGPQTPPEPNSLNKGDR